jgi:hypothetical protein
MAKMDVQAQFSADIRLDLVVGCHTIPLAKVGPNYAVLQEQTEVEAGSPALLIMKVDGREHRWEIVLDDGIVPFDDTFRFRVTRYPEQTSLFVPGLH